MDRCHQDFADFIDFNGVSSALTVFTITSLNQNANTHWSSSIRSPCRRQGSIPAHLGWSADGEAGSEQVLANGHPRQESGGFPGEIASVASELAHLMFPMSQAMLYATDGVEEESDFQKPMVGVASVWYEGNP